MSFFPEHPHSNFLLKVEKPARYAGAEYGSVAFSGNPVLSIVLAFPDIYEIGCSNLGITILYRIASSIPLVRVERVFAPWTDYYTMIINHDEKLLSFETATPVNLFDIVGFSLQHEMLYTNVLHMLKLAKIPLHSKERNENHPVVIAGGPCTSNPEPMSPFIDIFVIGDGEVILPRIIEAAKEYKAKSLPKQWLLTNLSRVEGIYVPSFYIREKKDGIRNVVTGVKQGVEAPIPVNCSIFREFKDSPVYEPLVTATAPVFDRFQVEISRGCGWGCRFCHASSVYKPVRHRNPEQIIKEVIDGVFKTGSCAISFSSLSPADYPFLEFLIEQLRDFIESEKIILSISSLRCYGVSRKVLEAVASVKATGITLAPEAGTSSLRSVIGKNVNQEDLIESIKILVEMGWRRVKLYFMVGLPHETDEDVDEIVTTINLCKKAAGTKRFEISVSISNFVPKAFTPFQWERMARVDELLKKRARVKSALRRMGVHAEFHNPYQSIIESIISRGGEELSGILEEVSNLGGYMESWSDRFDYRLWEKAFEKKRMKMEVYLDEINSDFSLPWSHIKLPVTVKFLEEEKKKAEKGIETSPCRATGRGSICNNCGASCERKTGKGREWKEKEIEEIRSWMKDRIERHKSIVNELFGEPLTDDERICIGLKFVRFGRAIYSGHRDIIRIMYHIFRRASLPLKFSSGFTPRPVLNFRCALPVGVAGLNEEVFVEVNRYPVVLDGILKIVQGKTHPGIDFFSIRVVKKKELKKIIPILPSILWFALIPFCVPLKKLQAVISELSDGESIKLRQIFKDRLNVRNMILKAFIADDGSFPEVSCLKAEGRILAFHTVSEGGKMIKVADLDRLLQEYQVQPRGFARKLLD